jgi:beta-phosphoglucomutase
MQRALAIVFDLDGVLLDSAPCHHAAFEEILQPLGIREFNYADYAGWRTAEVFETVLQKADIQFTAGWIAKLSAEKSRVAREKLAATNPIAPDCIAVLEELSLRCELALASSASRGSVDLFLTANGCAHLFRAVLCGADVQHAKPHPEIYERAFAALGVPPGDAVVVEDAVAGIAAARAAHAGTIIGVTGTCSASQLSAAGSTHVIHSLKELPDVLSPAYESANPIRN